MAVVKNEMFNIYDKCLKDETVPNEEKYDICLKMWEFFSSERKHEDGIYYLIQTHNYNKMRIDGIYELIKHHCCVGKYEFSFSFYYLIKDCFETNRKSINKTNSDIVNFYLPYYMIIVFERLKKYDNGIKMFEIIFEEKQTNIDNWWIGCLLSNLLFFIDKVSDEKFFRSCENYLNFLYSEYNNSTSFAENRVLLNLVKGHLKEENLHFLPCEDEKKFVIDKSITSKKIFIYTGFAYFWWNTTFGKENFLGGSERAVAFISEYFPKNMEIYIGGEVIEETIGNIRYIHLNNLEEFLKNNEFHAIIISRYIGFFEQYSFLKTKQLIVWAHDVMLLPYNSKNNKNEYEIVEKYHDIIDCCICLTSWHKEDLTKKYPLLKDKVKIISNGLDFSLFPETTKIKIKNRFVYSSNPLRGLKRLLELWPDICVVMPDAELKIVGLEPTEEDLKLLLKNSENVEHLGKKNPKDLYEILATCDIWFYPTNFNETYCITAIEMLYSKVVPVYYSFAGLTETVGDYGIAVKEGEELQALASLTEERKDVLRSRGRAYAEECSWENRAKIWNDILHI